jgi:hypothetical protein
MITIVPAILRSYYILGYAKHLAQLSHCNPFRQEPLLLSHYCLVPLDYKSPWSYEASLILLSPHSTHSGASFTLGFKSELIIRLTDFLKRLLILRSLGGLTLAFQGAEICTFSTELFIVTLPKPKHLGLEMWMVTRFDQGGFICASRVLSLGLISMFLSIWESIISLEGKTKTNDL